MDTAIVALIFVTGIALVVDVVLVRRRAAAETKSLHLALDAMTHQIAALVTAADTSAILESVPGFLVARDLEGKVTFITAAAARMMNATPGELLGSTPASLKNFQSGTKTLEDFGYLVQLSGKSYPDIEINYDPPGGGSRMRLLCSVAPLRDLETGAIAGTVAILSVIDNYRSRW